MRLGRLEQRLLAVVLAVLALALVYLALVHWWFIAPQQAISQQMQSLREQQSRYVALIAQRQVLRRRLAVLAQGQADSSAFLPGSDPSAAAAGLMQRVVQVAQQAGNDCTVTQKMPVSGDDSQDEGGDKRAHAYRAVTVNISLRCGMRPLTTLLYRLEYGMPDLFVGNFSAYRLPTPRSDGSLQPLEVQFALTGYIRAGQAHAAAATGSQQEAAP